MPNNLGKRFTELLDETVTKAEISAFFTKTLDFVKEAKTRLETIVSDFKREVSATLDSYAKRLETAEKSLSDGLSEGKEQYKGLIYSESRTLMRLIEQKAIELEAMMSETYDDTAIKASIEDVRRSIPVVPEQFNPASILSDLAALITRIDAIEKAIEEVKKRPAVVGGGVTNLRIQQAFKYILKTEEPTGDIDGVNTTYTVSQPIFAVLSFSLNGETIAQIPNYTVKGRTITFATALPAAYSGKDFEIRYI